MNHHMITTPNNKILLTLDKLYTDELILSGGLKLYLDPSYRPEWNVTVSGNIAALPKDGLPGFKVGDRVFFSYHIVNERKWEDDKKFFVRNKLGNEFVREYTDKLGGTIKVIAFPEAGRITKRWGATYVDEKGNFIDGCQGSEPDIDRWMAANFKYGYSQDMIYKNLLEIDGRDYWMADVESVFAIKKKGQLHATPGYAICKPISYDISQRVAISEGIHLPANSVVIKPEDRGKVVSMGEQKGLKVSAKEGDTVLFENRLVEKYTFEGEQFFIVRHRRLLAVV